MLDAPDELRDRVAHCVVFCQAALKAAEDALRIVDVDEETNDDD